METKKRKIGDIRQKTREIGPSVTAHSELITILIDAISDLHESVLELSDKVDSIAKPIDATSKTTETPETTPEKKGPRGWFKKKTKKE